MGRLRNVSASIWDKAFLHTLVWVLTHYGGRCGSALSK
jgi:hypothetical protein